MASDEQITHLRDVLSPYYNLETGEPLQGLDPLPVELAQWLDIQNGQGDDVDVQP